MGNCDCEETCAGVKGKWSYLKKEDFLDLMQEVLAHWHFVRDRYDSTRDASKATFMAKVVRAKLQEIVRSLSAMKRKADQTAVSLDEPFSKEEDARTLIEEISEEKPTPADIVSQKELKEKMRKANRKLTPEQKAICRLLKDGLDVTKISRKLHKHRSSIHYQIKRIKGVFEAEGLNEFLK